MFATHKAGRGDSWANQWEAAHTRSEQRASALDGRAHQQTFGLAPRMHRRVRARWPGPSTKRLNIVLKRAGQPQIRAAVARWFIRAGKKLLHREFEPAMRRCTGGSSGFVGKVMYFFYL